ncbi:hypothetical protein BDB00DRAFT_869335 [Zychaea mexicana]|uniref:uncharacterized protein n=1 Tax=Zychaea mexicana TaxID=64656 RepID=UPI0022FF23CF|nr:uncharacterized protein BDB00DRAFT_869335 [Zychaea mexicana]KAI9496392.1 hypothetical protein BDB00DRAFT_869335 [Zychaea mexicana]
MSSPNSAGLDYTHPPPQHHHQQAQPPLSPRYSHEERDSDGATVNVFKAESEDPLSLALERKTMSITPPLDEINSPLSISKGIDASEQPLGYSYLLNLFTAPDMRSYLAQANFTEDVYAMPIHLQRLMSEAKEENVIARTQEKQGIEPQGSYNATRRLERLREYVWARAGHDISTCMRIVYELIEDEDELINILNTERSVNK